jgi:uncharacterized protein YbjT (DUF2867 family)
MASVKQKPDGALQIVLRDAVHGVFADDMQNRGPIRKTIALGRTELSPTELASRLPTTGAPE